MQKTSIAALVALLVTGTLLTQVGLLAQADPRVPGPQGTPTPQGRSYRPIPPPANFAPPVIACDAPDYDWGTVIQGEKVSHDYVMKNTGGSPLIIQQVRPSCGCTMAGKPDKPIPPGGTGIVTLEIDTKSFTGPIKKTAAVTSNALPNPLTLTIGGIVESLFTLEPRTPQLKIPRGVPCEPVKVTLRRNQTAKVPFTVKDVRAENPAVTTRVTEVTPGELYEIAVSADVGLQDDKRYLYEKVNVSLALASGKTFQTDFSVSITVSDRIEIQPRTSVYFNRNETKPLAEPGAQAVSKTLDIVSLGGSDHSFAITGVTSAPAATPTPAPAGGQPPPAVPQAAPHYFDTKVETVTPGKHYRLTVSMSALPDQKLRTVRERFVIQTDDPSVKELSVTAMAAVY